MLNRLIISLSFLVLSFSSVQGAENSPVCQENDKEDNNEKLFDLGEELRKPEHQENNQKFFNFLIAPRVEVKNNNNEDINKDS